MHLYHTHRNFVNTLIHVFLYENEEQEEWTKTEDANNFIFSSTQPTLSDSKLLLNLLPCKE